MSLRVEDIAEAGDGRGSILIRRLKTDATGEGAAVYLSPMTLRFLKGWLSQAGIREESIFRRVAGDKAVGSSLTPQVVATIFRKVNAAGSTI